MQQSATTGSAGTASPAQRPNQQCVSPVPRLDLAAMHHRRSGNGGLRAGKRRTSIVGFASKNSALRQSGPGAGPAC